MKSKLKRFGKGFIYAWNGIRAAVREERNFRFHLVAALLALWVSALAELQGTDLAMILLCVGAVMALELMNSAVERAVDKPDTTHWWSAGAAKDMAAGGVLVMAVASVAVAVCLLVPRFALIWEKVCTFRPWQWAALVVAALAAYFFIFNTPNQTQKGKDPNGK